MRFFTFFTSLRLTVICLLVSAVLVVWGTCYQVEFGLYQAQEKFFYAWFVPVWGFLPVPGGKLVMWVLFFNLLFSMLIHFHIGWRVAGVILIHLGLLLMLAGGYFTHLTGNESYLPLLEGEGSNVSIDYREWELSVWQGEETERKVTAVDDQRLTDGASIALEDLGLNIKVENYYENARALKHRAGPAEGAPLSVSGITALTQAQPDHDPQKNVPGAVMTFRADSIDQVVMLYGGDIGPTSLALGDTDLRVQLRRRRYPLPLYMRLIDFKKEQHPNSQMYKSFASLVEVTDQHAERDAVIEMNRPLRYGGYTFYQASFSEGSSGEVSTFAVALNYGRIIPYIATGITSLGLAVHFLLQLYFNRVRKSPKGATA